jgi:rSAM/selenodomain-associated transferase 2
MTSTLTPQLSIIIPALNEADALPNIIASLTEQLDIRSQIIVADGGSTDGTLAFAEQHPQIELVHAPAGRGLQMNEGATQAKSEWLLFIHADSLIKDPKLLTHALRQSHPDIAGHFSLSFFDRTEEHALRYSVLEAKSKLTKENTTNGDQGLLIHRDLFVASGRFSTRWHFLEDQTVNERLRKQGKLTLLRGCLHTSARRFEKEGFNSRYLLMTLLMTAWSCGLYDFVDNARGAYREQSNAQQLSLIPFANLFRKTHQQKPLQERLRLISAYGSYARRNAWQPLLWLGFLLFNTRHTRLVTLHDKLLAPILRLPVIKQIIDIFLGAMVSLLIFYLGPALIRLRAGKPR